MSQGPKKKSIQVTKGRIDPCPAHTARNKGSFTTMVLWTVNPLFPQLYVYTSIISLYSLIFQSISPSVIHCIRNMTRPGV